MKINELKASELKAFEPVGRRLDLPAVNAPQSSYWESQRVSVEYRGLSYTVGRWGDWQGDFYVVECRTGIIFRGSLAYIREIIRVCSAAHHDSQPFRSSELRVSQ